jgi:hypothetical protein
VCTNVGFTTNKSLNVNSENTLIKRKKRLDNDVPQLIELKNLPSSVKLRFKTKTISTVLSYETLLILDMYIKYSESLAPSYSGQIHYGSVFDGLAEQLKEDENFIKFCQINFSEAMEIILKR